MARYKSIDNYKTLVFDCDGVVLNSNKVKTDAFYKVALTYGEEAAKAFVAYHTSNGGISRYKKFDHFLKTIVPELSRETTGPKLAELLQRYADLVYEGLLECERASGLKKLRQQTPSTRWLIVSGGDQAELRTVFKERGLIELFDGGIFGSPDTKDQILAREMSNNNIQQPALFLGDSKYDYHAAKGAGLEFIFLTEWTEVENWGEWCSKNSISFVNCINDLLDK